MAATPGGWTKLNPATSPPAMNAASSAYDAARNQVVLFEGGQTWTWDGATWTQQHPITSPASSPPTFMAFDPAIGNAVLVQAGSSGSCPTSYNSCQDTWLWDGANWIKQNPLTQPYCIQAMVFDAARNLVLGHGTCGLDRTPGPETTWTWDGANWTLQGGSEPSPPRMRHELAYDPAHKQVVLFGSTNSGNDTWTWDGSNWTLAVPYGSAGGGVNFDFGLNGSQIIWDGTHVVLFAFRPPCPGVGSTEPFLEWNWTGSRWVELPQTSGPDQFMSGTTWAFDGTDVLDFGGGGLCNPAPTNETWVWSSGAVQPRPYTGGHDAVGIAAGATDAYFAEGYTGLNFREYLTVENPGSAQTLTVQYFTDSGAVITKTHPLLATSRTTISVNGDVGPDQTVSAHLSAPSPFVAERPMYFSLGGRDGGHDAVGAASPGTTFYFAEGYTGTGFSEFLTLMNPGATGATVNVTYYFASGQGPKTVTHPVMAHSRATVLVNDPAEAGAGQNVSMKISSDQPIVAERPMYFNYFGETGGSDVVGATTLLTDMNLAEGHVGQGFDEYLTFLNPNPQAATADVTYYRGSGAPATQQLLLPANSRTTVHVNYVLPSGTDSSVHVHSSLPILVERPMYFVYHGWSGGHDAIAVPDAAVTTTQYFAEGMVAPNFAEYYTIMNRNPQAANVTITYYDQNGTAHPKPIVIPAQSRWTEPVNSDLPAYTANSAVITSDVPILAERPMYFSY